MFTVSYNFSQKHKDGKGFTLIELLSVVAIIIVLTAVSSPFLGAMYARYQAESAGDHILASLNFCRIESFKRSENIICQINTNTDTNRIVSKVILDSNDNGIFDQASDTLVSSSTMTGTSFLALQPTNLELVFNKRGISNITTTQVLKLCAGLTNSLRHLYSIRVDINGRAIIEAGDNNACTT